MVVGFIVALVVWVLVVQTLPWPVGQLRGASEPVTPFAGPTQVSSSPLRVMGRVVGADEQEVSVRAFLRSMRSVAFWMLLLCIFFWALLVWTDTSDRPAFWQMLLAWPVVTIWFGPVWWLRNYPRHDAPGWWPGLAVAMLWGLVVCPILLGMAYAAAVSLFGFGR